MFKRKILLFISTVTLSSLSNVNADDTELYIVNSSQDANSRAKVLIIFDNSGSMSTTQQSSFAAYNPSFPYESMNDSPFNTETLYFSKGGTSDTSLPTPDSLDENRRFQSALNGCNQSKAALAQFGRFTGYLREYKVRGQTGTWEEVPDNNGANIQVIDCYEDIVNEDSMNANGVSNGFPVDAKNQGNNVDAYNYTTGNGGDVWGSALDDASRTQFGIGRPVTIYTDNYLRWYTLGKSGQLPSVSKSRLEIAKEAITSFISSNNSADFGLAIFNLNYPNENNRDGGRIITGIHEMTTSNKIALMNTINGTEAETNTPLCETMYEAYRYFSGKNVYYGDDDSNYSSWYEGNTPPRDTSISPNGKYISPFKTCTDRTFVIYITDGVPTVDAAANDEIIALTNGADEKGDYNVFNSTAHAPSYLPALASYMFHNDLVDQPELTHDPEQKVVTFTIGFSAGAQDAAPLLTETAKRGGGKYTSANSGVELESALTGILVEALQIDSSFTSPSIASNNFDRTQTFDSAYFAMFLPNKGPRWSGNLKKLKVRGDGVLIDSSNQPAIATDGSIKDTACSFWSSCSPVPDGNKVLSGGVNETLQSDIERKIYVNGSSGATLMTKSSLVGIAGSSEELAAYMDVDKNEIENTIKWLHGDDVDDEDSTSNRRADIMGDPLHSKPLALNFGSKSSPDTRIILGTNQGLIHMFEDDGGSVDETWAFMPYELLPNVSKLRANIPTGGHTVYGMDLSPAFYVEHGATGITKAWIFMGMRRGGSSYYAIDITSKSAPLYKWKIDGTTLGLPDLGQTWSVPEVTKIPGHDNPVLIFGAGYSPSKKDSTQLGLDDDIGRGVVIVDAFTGDLVHYFSATSGTGRTQIPGITDSIPNPVAVLDSDGDGKTDRIYATDTGANVWRLDLPSSLKSKWSAFKFASLGGDEISKDRRFFAAPSVAQTLITNYEKKDTTVGGETTTEVFTKTVPYDAVTVGSGSRPTPLDKQRDDMFFVLQDRNVVTQTFGADASTIPDPLTIDTDLFDVTSVAPTNEAQNIAFSFKKGWFYKYKAVGEKSLSAPTIISGKVFFTTYVPQGQTSANQCSVGGKGRFYGFDLHRGRRVFTQEFYDISANIPDTPQLVVPPNGELDSNMYLIGIGAAAMQLQKAEGLGNDNCPEGDERCIGSQPSAKRIYYYNNE